MAHVADHLSVSALEQQYRSCTDVTAARHLQAIWLLAKGHHIAEVAATVSYARRWVERLLAREFVARIGRLASGEGGRRWTNPSDDPGSPMPFKANADRRHRIPKQRRRTTNWAEYDAALRQRGSLTVWFTEDAIAAWHAEPRTTPGGQPHYSALAITTALTLKAVFRLALRQTEGLIGSIIRLLGLTLRVPDHTTLSRRAATLEVPRPR